MRVIAVINQKGGVGKTTATVNVGRGLSLLGKKVMLIDMDPQSHMTYSLGVQAHELGKSIYDLLKGEASLADVTLTMNNHKNLKIIPSTLDLSGAEIELASVPGRESILKECLKGIKGIDFVLMDCPPGLGLLTLNALTTAKELFICLQTEYLALQGIGKLMETVEIVRKRLNRNLGVSGIICTRFDRRKKLNREVVHKIKEYFGETVFRTMIRENVAIAEAPTKGLPIFDYAPKSNGAADYMSLCKEIIKRGGSDGK
ncbi:MAG TPA: ParA family protein [Syntrophorhabdaceae bacterium]|jgi:chromosome partitioning protein